jgi:GNAT superfamily N-acetyltransferase
VAPQTPQVVGTPTPASHSPVIKVVPATDDRFDDVRAVLAPKSNAAQACWCLTYRISGKENSELRGEARPLRLRSLCREGHAPGVIAYVVSVPAGWCAVSPRTAYERLNRSRTIQRLDDQPVWSIVCLVVRSGFRRIGVARALIQGAVDHAVSQGAPCIEAYPIEPNGDRVSSTLAFTGTTSMFAAAGFTQCAVTNARSAGKPRVIMRRNLG